ncbi:NSFL1 cofactor p47 homolog isoform X2 [Hylaeus volcanicus]|uniref:NSFL1 cofactor p47 homolog isoform X2 n=1 Tax=Hylaeus volcanicus TaxID=313075 RepID=UPI0023B77D22|nr:NSFL1 cofactor p47 homolog isoform X2 [Hylaeus volcanicus]
MNIHSLFDNRRKDENDDETKRSFVGGERSGLSVQHPPCSSGLCSSGSSGSFPKGTRKITLYKNGFCLDGGEFRPLSEPENAEMISAINSGYVPKELSQTSSSPVSLILEDLRSKVHEVPSQPKSFLYSGEEQSTNSSTEVIGSFPVDVSRYTVQIDTTRPVTTLKFRFYDGTTVSQQFNEHQTIEDVHNFVFQAAPVECSYRLLSGFPPTPINSCVSMTLQQAGLLNETIIQRCGE